MKKQVAALYRLIREEKLLTTLVVMFWLFLFLTTVSKTYSYFVRHDIPLGLDYILLEAFFIWGLVAILVPVFVWLAEKYPVEGDEKFRNTAIHISISLLWVPIHALLFEIIMYFIDLLLIDEQTYNTPFSWGTWESYLGTIMWMGIVVSLTYWLVIGGYHIKKYYTQFKERQLRNIELEAELASIRLHVLKSQLHPHFLFNTLHNVNTLIHEDPAAAERILALLKRFLELSIQRVDDQQVPLKDEMEFTNIYLEIEKTRFGDRLTTETDIAPSTFDAQVPSLILQPLVENAVIHGISKQMKPGILKVTAQRVAAFLHLTVEDNGPGLDEEEMNPEGVGLKNINQRLNQLYQESAFELGTSSLGGLKVIIKIPFRSTKKTVIDNV